VPTHCLCPTSRARTPSSVHRFTLATVLPFLLLLPSPFLWIPRLRSRHRQLCFAVSFCTWFLCAGLPDLPSRLPSSSLPRTRYTGAGRIHACGHGTVPPADSLPRLLRFSFCIFIPVYLCLTNLGAPYRHLAISSFCSCHFHRLAHTGRYTHHTLDTLPVCAALTARFLLDTPSAHFRDGAVHVFLFHWSTASPPAPVPSATRTRFYFLVSLQTLGRTRLADHELAAVMDYARLAWNSLGLLPRVTRRLHRHTGPHVWLPAPDLPRRAGHHSFSFLRHLRATFSARYVYSIPLLFICRSFPSSCGYHFFILHAFLYHLTFCHGLVTWIVHWFGLRHTIRASPASCYFSHRTFHCTLSLPLLPHTWCLFSRDTCICLLQYIPFVSGRMPPLDVCQYLELAHRGVRGSAFCCLGPF